MIMSEDYHIHIDAGVSPISMDLKEVWRYRDLIWLFTLRNFKLIYKQTVLGPLWIIFNPLFTSIIYTVVFGNIAGLSTAGVPKLLFYLCSHSLWVFFAECLNRNSATFRSNAHVFSKVYFPRLTISVSSVLYSAMQLLIQMCLVLIVILFYVFRGEVHPGWEFIPAAVLAVLFCGIMGLGLGILISSVTTKYRDLAFLVGFGLSLWMYASPVIYPMSVLPEGWMRTAMMINPMSAPMEVFRMAFLGVGSVSWISIVSTVVFSALFVVFGVIVFNRVERSFIDTI